jgi:nucleoside-diphosphate-sugar epimerase
MKILITGGTGIIGTKLTTLLFKKNGNQLRLLILDNKIHYDKKIELCVGNLLDYQSLEKATRNIDLVVHLAGLTHSHENKKYFEINIDGTKNLLKSCEFNCVKKFIFISSTAACKEGGSYSYSKLLAEEEVKKFKNNWVILRLSEVYGAGKNEAIARLIKSVREKIFVPIIGDGNYLLSPVYINDVLQAIIKSMAEQISNKTYIIAGPEVFTFRQVVTKIEEVYKVKKIQIFIPVIFLKLLAAFSSLFKLNLIYKDQIPRLLCQKSYNIFEAQKDFQYNPANLQAGLSIYQNDSEKKFDLG